MPNCHGNGLPEGDPFDGAQTLALRELYDGVLGKPVEALGAFRAALDDLERLVNAGDAAAIEAALDRIRRVRETVV